MATGSADNHQLLGNAKRDVARILGYSPAQLLGHTFDQLVHATAVPQCGEILVEQSEPVLAIDHKEQHLAGGDSDIHLRAHLLLELRVHVRADAAGDEEDAVAAYVHARL
mgnify:CR=1 FL=1